MRWWWLWAVLIGVGVAVPLAWFWSRHAIQRARDALARAAGAEHLAELGTLTGGLAHEIKNPLSTVGLNLQLIQEDLAEVRDALPVEDSARTQLGRVQKRFDTVHREAARLREILEDFLRFAGRFELDRQPVDLVAMLDELADFFEPQADQAGVRLRRQFPAEPVRAEVDPTLLKQAVLNLMINAVQAMEDAKRDDRAHGGANELMLAVEPSRGRRGPSIRVIDTGPGIDSDRQAEIFRPYVSTKRSGTGLGLPTTRRIVREHGGDIALDSTPGQGCQFEIQLAGSE